MTSNTVNFNQIFREVDEKIFGPEHHHIPQKDTSNFEKLYKNDDPTKVMDSEFDIMKDKEIKIVLPQSNSSKTNQDNLRIGVYVDERYIKEWRSKETNDKQISNMTNIEFSDWYNEVKHIMEIDTEPNLEKEKEKKGHHASKDRHRLTLDANKIPIHIHTKVQLPDEIAPFSCFEPDYINIDCPKDPLEELIPNPEPFDEFLQPDFEVLKDSNKTDISQQDGKNQQHTSSTSSSTTSSSNPPKNSSNDSRKDTVVLDDLFERYNKRISERNFVSDGAQRIIDREAERKQRQLQKTVRIRAAGQNKSFDASSSLEKDRGDRRNRDISTFHSQNRSFIASVNHHLIARHHRNTKPDLTETELKHFHRPRLGKETTSKSWRITLNSYSKKKAPISTESTTDPTTLKQSIPILTEEEKKNLSLSNNNHNFMLLEYVEEFPPIMLNPGMASILINYYRPPKQQEDIHNNTNSTSTSSTINHNDQQSIKRRKINEEELELYEKVLPSHVLSLYKLNYIDRLFEVDPLLPKQKLGKIKVINDNDKSPFLGQLKEKEIQISFENNLFRVPLYEYCPTTDFLIIREDNHPSTSSSTTNQNDSLIPFSIREIPNIFIAGQIEPQKIVPPPTLELNETQKQFYLLAAMKYYRKFKQQRMAIPSWQEVMKHILRFCSDEDKTPHKFTHRLFFQPQISNIPQGLASYIRPLIDSNISILLFRNPRGANESMYDYHEPEDNSLYSYENLLKQLSPENICLQEASISAEYRLLAYHNITYVTVQAIANYLYFWDIAITNFKERIEKFKDLKSQLTVQYNKLTSKQYFTNNNQQQYESATSSFQYLTKEETQVQLRGVDILIKLLQHDIERIYNRNKIARFILGRIVIAPWNTTHTFVNSILLKDISRGRMDIRGIGDPSGRGEAFAYVIIPPDTLFNKLSPDELNKKKKAKLVGTNADLRKLGKEEQIDLLISLGYTRERASQLQRWDRIHIIRENVNKSNRMNSIISTKLAKYIRDDANPFGQSSSSLSKTKAQLTEEEFKGFCQLIWEKQKTSLFDNAKLSLSKEARQREKKRQKIDQQVTSPDTSPDLSPEMSPEVPSQHDPDDDMDEDDDDDLTSTYLDDQTESEFLRQRKEKLNSLFAHGLTSNDGLYSLSSSSASSMRRKVVKRVIRTLNIYGHETIKIQFLLDSSEVARVEEKEHRMISEAPDKHGLTALLELKQKYTLPFLNQRKNTKKSSEYGDEYDDIDEGKQSRMSTSMTINLSKGKRSNGLGPNGGNRRNQDMDFDDYLDEEREVMHKTISSKRSGANLQTIKNSRLPRVALAAKFESELMIIWNSKNAGSFHYPVDRIQYPNYYVAIKFPISLSDIREKIASFQYDSAHQLLQDMELLKNNAIQFNGNNHPLARQASSLYDTFKRSLYRDRELLGIDRDSIHILEEIIRKKPHSSHVPFN